VDTLQRLLCDVFRDLVIRARDNSLWEKTTPDQIENLVSRYLLQHYCSSGRPDTPSPKQMARTERSLL
jgi:hypothetical protein